MRQLCGQLSGHVVKGKKDTLHIPFPLPDWNIEIMAGTAAAILDHETEGM